MKIIGYDDSFVSTITEPSISTIHVPKVSAGVKAANLLFSLMDRNKDDLIHEPVGFRMEGRLIVRNSTVPGMDEENWLVSEW
ncbi:substrate-binding domain-containing protein [Treponema parvum]|uniref:substrate-binding domain-containing protein n=1 Tax=Treponema parvum TaxID=138851 RepID=UPI003B831A05